MLSNISFAELGEQYKKEKVSMFNSLARFGHILIRNTECNGKQKSPASTQLQEICQPTVQSAARCQRLILAAPISTGLYRFTVIMTFTIIAAHKW